MVILSFLLFIVAFISVEPCSNNFVPDYPSFMCAPEFGGSYVHVASNGFFKLFGVPWPFEYYFLFILSLFLLGSYLNKWSFDRVFLFLSIFLLTFGADSLLLHGLVAFPYLYRFRGNVVSTLIYGLVSGPLSILSGFVSLRTLWIPIVILLLYPVPDFPNYPDNARVLNDIYPELTAWIGSSPRPIILDRELMSSLFLLPALILLILGFKDKVIRICSVLLLIDYFSFPPGVITELSPITVIARIIPGWSYIPVPFVVFAIGVVRLTTLGIWNLRVAAIVALFFSIYLGHPSLVSEPKFLTPNPSEEVSLALRSPSSRLLRSNTNIIENLKNTVVEDFSASKGVRRFQSRLFASTGDVKEIGTGHRTKRWNSKLQNGTEWVGVKFNFEQRIRGVVLETGDFHSDYPRLLEFSWALDCPEELTGETLASKVTVNPEKIKFLADGVYPYLATPSNVRVVLDEPKNVRCLMFKQLGKSSEFDWSINDIVVLK